MQLYYAKGTIAVAALIALYEAGVEAEPRRVDFASAEQTKPDYQAVNPKGRVPALVTDAGVLTETGAILEFIAASSPGSGLVPSDPFSAAKMREAMYYLASTVHVNHAHKMRGSRWADLPASHQDMAAKVPETMTASAAYIENHMLTGPFVLGDAISLADCYLYVVCCWFPGDGVALSDFPKISAFIKLMDTRSSVQTARANNML